MLHQIVNSKVQNKSAHPIAPMACLLFATVHSCHGLLHLAAAATAAAAAAFVCCSHVASLAFTAILSSHLLHQLPLAHCICISPLLPHVCRSSSCYCHLSAIHSADAAVVTVLPPLVTTAVCYPSSLLPPVCLCCLLPSII